MDGGKETPELDLCTNATVLDDDWRHPSEEDKKKCDNKLAINRWYKFRYQGASGLIAMGPIKENHCSTTGSLSIFRQSPNFQYPPPVNQSSIYTTCVHVKILGVVSCIDHMIIPVIALTCPNNDVIYYITRTAHICPSAFCVIGSTEKVDEYYWLRNDENVKPTTSKQASIRPSHHLRHVITFETALTNQTQSDMNESTRKLKRIISESINNPGWRDDDCFQEHLNQLSEHTCIYRRLNKSSVFVARTVVDIIWTKALKLRSENNSTVGVYDKNINKSRQSSDMYDDDTSGLNISTHTDKSNATQTDDNCTATSDARIFKSLCDIDASENQICQTQVEDVHFVKLNQVNKDNVTRWSVVAGKFCDCTKENDTLFYVLMWLNWTGAIQNTTGSEVVKLYKGLPSDELPPLVLPSVSIYPTFFYCIFWPMCILLIVFAVLIIYYQVQCCNAFYLFQREKIIIIDCDNRANCLTPTFSSLKRAHAQRSRLNTAASISGSAQSSKRQFVKMSSIDQHESANKTTKNEHLEASTSFDFREEPVSEDMNTSVQTTLTNSQESSGWIVPVREFEKIDKKSITVPKMVVDTKKRSKRRQGNNSFASSDRSTQCAATGQSSEDESDKYSVGISNRKITPVVRLVEYKTDHS